MIDVVPVDPTTVDQWTYPPYSGYFDGEFLLCPGAMDTHLPLCLSQASVSGDVEAPTIKVD